MKKLPILILLLALSLHLSAQEFWFEAGIKGGAGLSFLYNKNIADDSNWDYALSPMFTGGAKFSANFGPHHCIVLEGMYAKAKQDWNYSLRNSMQDQDYSVEWSNIDMLLLYRGVRNGGYFEIGPKYSLMQKVEQGNKGETLGESTDFYESSYLGGVFGVGGLIAGGETFSIGIGMRLHYGFGDIVNSEGQALGMPNVPNDAPYSSEATTHPAYAQILMEFNFGLGHYAKTSCGQRFKKMRRR